MPQPLQTAPSPSTPPVRSADSTAPVARRRLHEMYFPKPLQAVIRRERARADRLSSPFCLVMFRLVPSGGRLAMLRLSRLVLQAVRTTDEVGLYDRHTVCAILPDTGADGAMKLIRRTRESCYARGMAVEPVLYTYPNDGSGDQPGGPGHAAAAEMPQVVGMRITPADNVDAKPLPMGLLLSWVGRWYSAALQRAAKVKVGSADGPTLSNRRIVFTVMVLLGLIFSKHLYLAGMSTFYTFYLINRFGVSIQEAQIFLFIFLGAVAAGTIIGGPIGDKVGRRSVIWVSILGVLPFTLALPFASLAWTGVLSVVIGLILASAFSAIVVFAQELIPGRVGLVGGLFFGFAFGIAGLGAAVLGEVADHTSIEFVFKCCALLPALGILAFLLPRIEPKQG